MRKNVCYINYDLPFDADMQIFTAQLYLTKPLQRLLNIQVFSKSFATHTAFFCAAKRKIKSSSQQNWYIFKNTAFDEKHPNNPSCRR